MEQRTSGSTEGAPVDAKVENPHQHFATPAEVIVDPELSKTEKARALENLEQDARQLAIASAEGMTGGERGTLREVLEAKDALQLPPFDLAVTAVLQGLRAKLETVEGTPGQAVIADAITAVEAARAALQPPAPASPKA